MNKVVGIQFRNNGKVYDFDPGPFVLKRDDKVMVITEEGAAVGNVCSEPRNRGEEIPKRPLRKIFRLATDKEIERFERSCAHEKNVYEFCYKKIMERFYKQSAEIIHDNYNLFYSKYYLKVRSIEIFSYILYVLKKLKKLSIALLTSSKKNIQIKKTF